MADKFGRAWLSKDRDEISAVAWRVSAPDDSCYASVEFRLSSCSESVSFYESFDNQTDAKKVLHGIAVLEEELSKLKGVVQKIVLGLPKTS